jgi:hypothetical protein
MSNKTEFKPKVLVVHGAPHAKETKVHKAAVEDTDTSNKQDTYSAETTNGYRRMVNGRMDPVRYEAIQGILGNLLPEPQAPVAHYIPNVPTLEDIFKASPYQYRDMKPVLDRYLALEKMILAQIAENKRILNPKNMTALSAPELANLKGYEKDLEKQLLKCREQIDQSEIYYKWQRQNELKASKEEFAGLDEELD